MATPASPRRRSSTSPRRGSTTKWSGVTAPETTASPSPGLASITARRRRPERGSAVNRTPATAASTSTCTTTARRTPRGSIPFAAR